MILAAAIRPRKKSKGQCNEVQVNDSKLAQDVVTKSCYCLRAALWPTWNVIFTSFQAIVSMPHKIPISV